MELKNRLKEIIQDEIKNFSMEQLKVSNSPEVTSNKKSDYDKIREAEDELKKVDNILFFGGEDPDKINKSKQRYIKENEEVSDNSQSEDPRITQTEIDQFEKDFREKVSPMVQFSKKEDGSVNFDLYKGVSGVEAKVSGIIPIKAENKIEWSYSLQNGSYVNMNAELTTEVSETLNKMAFFYEQWKRDWTEKLTEIPGTTE